MCNAASHQSNIASGVLGLSGTKHHLCCLRSVLRHSNSHDVCKHMGSGGLLDLSSCKGSFMTALMHLSNLSICMLTKVENHHH